MAVTIHHSENSSMRLDRAESVFFARETEHIMTRTYDAKPKKLKAFGLIPINTEAGPGADEITFRRFNSVGLAKIIADYAKDFPRVDVYGVEDTVKIKSLGNSYGYNIKEIRRSIKAGKRLDQRRAAAARKAHDERSNKMALISMPEEKTRGALNYPGMTEATLPADGTGGSKRWRDKNVDQILRDIDVLMDSVSIPTNGQEEVDTILLPMSAYRLLTHKRLGTDGMHTLMKYIRENYPEITRIEWLNELNGIGTGGTDRIVVGTFDPEHIEWHMPSPFEQFDPEQHGMEYSIACHSECAGTIMYYPMAFAYADGL
jgi:hypothetical protein